MHRRRCRTAWLFTPLALLALPAPALRAETPPASAKTSAALDFSERVIAGGPDDFMEVRHLVLRGSNEAIGRKLAEIARDRFGARPTPLPDPLLVRTRRTWFERNFPAHLARMRGAAAAFDADLADDRLDFGEFGYLLGTPPGCSVFYLPPSAVADGRSLLSRNYDFTTGTLWQQRPAPGELPCTARPYVIEVYPDVGHPALYIASYDLLGGALDGINAAGLTVAVLADDESFARGVIELTGGPSVGLNEIQLVRYLLDTCADVAEAKTALRLAKQYYGFLPCHYLIADRHGRSFVWEYSAAHNREYIIDGGGRPQVVTNFLLHRYPSTAGAPTTELAELSAALSADQFAAHPAGFSAAASADDDDHLRTADSPDDATISAVSEPAAPGPALANPLVELAAAAAPLEPTNTLADDLALAGAASATGAAPRTLSDPAQAAPRAAASPATGHAAAGALLALSAGLPEERFPLGSFNRYRAVCERLAGRAGAIDRDFVRETAACVAFNSHAGPAGVPHRTLWHAVYCPEDRSVEFNFYLGESPDPANPATPTIRRSDYVKLQLQVN